MFPKRNACCTCLWRRDDEGRTPLFRAAQAGRTQACAVLLNEQANPELRPSLQPKASLVSSTPEWLLREYGTNQGRPVSISASNLLRTEVSVEGSTASNRGLLDSWVVGLPAAASGTTREKRGRWRFEVEGRMEKHWLGHPWEKDISEVCGNPPMAVLGLSIGWSTPSAAVDDWEDAEPLDTSMAQSLEGCRVPYPEFNQTALQGVNSQVLLGRNSWSWGLELSGDDFRYIKLSAPMEEQEELASLDRALEGLRDGGPLTVGLLLDTDVKSGESPRMFVAVGADGDWVKLPCDADDEACRLGFFPAVSSIGWLGELRFNFGERRWKCEKETPGQSGKEEDEFLGVREASSGNMAALEAAQKGHMAACSLLLGDIPPQSLVAEVDREHKRTLLHWAAFHGDAHFACRVLALASAAGLRERCLSAQDLAHATPLYLAVLKNNFSCARVLVDAGAFLDTRDQEGRPPLCLAAEKGHSEAVMVLLEGGADKDSADKSGNTPLCLAARGGHWDAVKLLLEWGANIDHANIDGDIPLCIAAEEGHFEAMKMLLERGANIDHANNIDKTPLCIAAEKGHSEAVKVLMEEGANIDHANKHSGNTPLWLAAHKGHSEAMKLLLERGADKDHANNDRKTPLCLAARGGHLEAVKLLLKSGANTEHANEYGDTPLCLAAEKSDLEAMKLLLEGGANTDHANKSGYTPLCLAAEKGDLEAMKMLLKWDANIDHANKRGYTPLYLAVRGGDLEAVKMLLEGGANTERKNSYGETPLFIAVEVGHSEAMKVLLKWGANIDHASKNGNTPLCIAARRGDLEAMKMLLESGANIDHANKNGETPLCLAARRGDLEAMKMLLESGANIDHANKNGETPLCLAAEKGHSEAVKLLLERGADKEHTDKSGNTPKDIAVAGGYAEVQRLLQGELEDGVA